MTFEQALGELRAGRQARRSGWAGGDWLQFVPLAVLPESLRFGVDEEGAAPSGVRALVKISMADEWDLWEPTEADASADDWVVGEMAFSVGIDSSGGGPS